MTPKMIRLFSHALQVCLDEEYYTTRSTFRSSKFMCNALNAAQREDKLSFSEASKAVYFLSRWVRWMSHLIQYKTICMASVQIRVQQLNMDDETWFKEGHGIVFYRELIQRLQQKAARRAA